MSLKITWYDNAAFRVDTENGILWFDPSVDKNLDSPLKVEDIKEPARFVFTTHGDPGHFVNSVEITQRTGATFVSSEDLCHYVLSKKLLPKEKVFSLAFGEKRTLNDLEVYLFEAHHPELTPELIKIVDQWGGVKTRNGGFVVRGRDYSLCLLGDCIYSDIFKGVGQKFRIDIGMIPIQGKMHVDSTPEEAAENGAKIIRDLKLKILFPVVQYTKQRNRLEPLKRKLDEMGIPVRVIFDRPGVVHTLEDFGD